MTPDQAKDAYDAMSPEHQALFREYVGKVCAVVTALDAGLVEAGQAMAGEVEDWMREDAR